MAAPLATGAVTLKGIRVPYLVRRNARARRIWIKVEESEGLVVVLPRWGSLGLVQEVIRRHHPWILEQMARREDRLAGTPPAVGCGRTVFYRGRPIPLRVKSLACLAPSVLWRRNEVVVTVPRHEDVGVGEVLVRSLRERASAVIRRRVEALAEASGFRPRRVSVRDQKTRWGSCSGRGTLTFNWRLIFAPPSVLDYVVVHELCHLRHAHHGPRFWAAVEALCPNYQAHRDWLRDNGARLRVESA